MRNDEYLKKLFMTEGAVLKACNNPNVVKCFETIMTKRKFYLVLEFCKGGDLADYLDKKKRIPEPQAIPILKQILNGFRVNITDNSRGFMRWELCIGTLNWIMY